MRLIKSSLKYPQVTLTILFIVFAVGVYSLFNMPRREDPKVTIRMGLIIAYYPGANSTQVEDQVTKKLEQYLFEYSEVRKEKTFSTSRDGVVVINVELEQWVDDPDIFWSKLKHDLNVAKVVDLPKGVQGPIVNTEFGDTIAMLIALDSDSLDYSQLRYYAQKIEDDLRTVKGVSKIKRYGEQKEQITVTANSAQLAQYGVKFTQVMQILQSQNAINATGDIKTEAVDVPLYTKGYYNSENELRNQIIATTQTGQVVRLGDVANIHRSFAEPASIIDVNGHKSVMLSLEMQEGNNIVKFGEDVTQHLNNLQQQLPGAIKLTTIVNQPQIVDESISHFIREFLLAIISVIIVTILLLPFRVAAVAAMAIPVTVAVTFALLNLFGIELHQVSLAALIVVLGMVVDDAIVIADNYIELLDEGVDRWTAAWRSASDLVVPVLTATATIVAAFLPMIILTGSVGEFIFALPITVTISLASSFVIAMLLTPFLSHTFIKKGLHSHAEEKSANSKKKERLSLLDHMQNSYNSAIAWCMKHPGVTITFSLLSIVASGLLYFSIKQKFFPAAERNQFVVEVWMPSGTGLDKTAQVVKRVEALLGKDKRVINYASFIGTSAPRFYYNFSPEPPVSNYAQILINTETDEQTEELSEELNEQVNELIPEGRPHVRLMQQGAPSQAPVEVRVVGNDINRIKQIGSQVQNILQKTVGTTLIRDNFQEDYYGISINLKDEANRLGYTTSSIAGDIYTGFTGAPVSTIYEGNEPVNIVFQLEEKSRTNFNDIQNTYVTSPVTETALPLRQIAILQPEWHTGRIIHRNGMLTLTVQSETKDNVLASEVLSKIQPQIAKLALPPGYRIEYGGEYENQKETFSQMVVALVISIVLIFLILLLQFRNLKESLVVMFSIPLSLFGALFGLLATSNPFGFTAFIGLISLSGIVVRNAIILVDYTNLLISQGTDLRTAAMEAGKRRLRPIFLTAMAAAIGVLPMILSGSPLWSPLASVIAFGVVFSMVMALLVIPVLFVAVIKPKNKKELQQHKLL